ncbi:MAG: penicillin-binding transpeptidase domain-containing protein [Candidatus Eremiobacteraeota bacterium]|nr:penicillin-binding transpeptidase domain-containing protein [Candidatus Eremiobacteraeota bacterium]
MVLFVVLAARQLWVQVIAGPGISARAHNPRHALGAEFRGAILASDGTVLARTVRSKRQYPYGESLAQTVGYVSTRYGTSGIESAYDDQLRPPDVYGNPASQLVQIFNAARGSSTVGKGSNIVTTLNLAIQSVLAQQLSVHARGAGVVIDPRSGAILAIASVPSFDPNVLDASFPTISQNPQSPLLNRVTDGLYPPGSTFKIVTAASALDSGVLTMDSTFNDPGYFTVGDFTVHNSEQEATGTESLTGAFALSSNVDFAQIALALGIDKWYDYADRWGLGQSLDFQLPCQTDRIPERSTVSKSILAQLGFGQANLLVTPLRMALIASTVANGGVEPRPFIVRQIATPTGVRNTSPVQLATPISAETAQNVKNMMVAVVKRGTGTPAALSDATVAGKTGTATNPAGKPHSWFVAFAPAESPRVAVAIIIENAGYGAEVAAPIARIVLRTALRNAQ